MSTSFTDYGLASREQMRALAGACEAFLDAHDKRADTAERITLREEGAVWGIRNALAQLETHTSTPSRV